MSLPNCKLIYFPVSSRGEAVRLALHLADIPFEDKRVGFAEWGALKPTTPWGSLPVLELADGTVVGQSRAITRFVGRRTNLYPSDDLLAALADECMDGADDVMSVTMREGLGLSGAEKAQKRQLACQPGGATFVACQRVEALYERAARRLGHQGPYLTGELTVADLYVFACTGHTVSGFFDGVEPGFITAFPLVQAVRKAVATIPKLVAYYEAEASKPYNELNIGGTLTGVQYQKLLASSRDET
mmetsp:Transcript_9250/g.21490  ORF Transcript_9250/g.21490 Transcript_9250/m.21490 type:complete len:244 (-) Transcript_9250:159-890(-)